MYIHAKVTPHAREEKVEETREHRFTVSVLEKAENNEANERVHALLARRLGVPKNKLRLIRGHKGRNKLFEVLE